MNARRMTLRVLAGVVLSVGVLVLGTGASLGQEPSSADAATPQTAYLYAVADAYVEKSQASTNYGGADSLDLAHSYIDNEVYAVSLVRFGDLSTALPAGAIIDSAWLNLYLYDSEGTEGQSVSVTAYRLTDSWDENTVTWNSAAGLHVATPGVSGSVGWYSGWQSWVITGMADYWLSNPGQNYGVELVGPASGFYGRTLYSREYGSLVPQLAVEYHVPATATPTSTPTSVVLPTNTPTPTATGVVRPTNTPTPTATGVVRPTNTPTPTATGVVRPTNTPTPTATGAVRPTNTPTPTATLPADCPEMLLNGGFESGKLWPWGKDGTAGVSSLGHQGQYHAWLVEQDEVEAEIFQEVTLPRRSSPVRLSFWWRADAASEQPEDVMRVLIQYDEVADNVYTMQATAPLGRWRRVEVDLTGYAGMTVLVTFHASGESAVPATFRVDDVSLLACGAPTPTPTPGGPIVMNLCAVEDAYVNEMNPGRNYGDSPWLYVGNSWGTGEWGISRSLVRFDLDWIPADSDIHSALFQAAAAAATGVTPINVAVHPVVDEWRELEVIWDNQPLVDPAVVSVPVDLSTPQLYSWDVTGLVGQWVSGERRNLGLELRGKETGAAWLRGFESLHNQPVCPQLLLNLTAYHPVETPTPTPTATATPTATSPCTTADEAGNTPGASTNLTLFADKSAFICPSGDQDWYKFSAQDDNEITVRLPNPPTDYDLTLLNSDGYGADWSNSSGTASEFIRYTADRSGMWKVGVMGKAAPNWSKSQPYKLRVDVCGGPDDPANPGAGDSAGWPVQLATGVSHKGWICPQWDEDWYEFTVPPGQAQINAILSGLPKNYMMRLYDPEGVLRASSQQNGPPEETITHTANNQPGKWQLVVQGLSVTNPDWDAAKPYYLLVTTPPLPDFSIMGIEVVQVTQSITGTTPLVADKATTVRVYVDSGPATAWIPNVTVELRGWKGTASLGTLTRTNAMGKVTLANARLNLWSSFNFILPNSWLGAGTLQLGAQVNPGNVLPETNYSNNYQGKQAKFYSASPANIWLVCVQANNLTPATNDSDLLDSLAYLDDIFPISYVQIWGVPNWTLTANYNYVTNGVICRNGWTQLLNDLQDLYDNWKNRPANSTIYGYMDQGLNSPDVAGCGRTGVAAGRLGANSNTTMAHEVGHAYGLLHAPCGGPSDLEPGWPYNTNPNAIIGEVGVRPASGTGGQLFDPNASHDLMSYCGNRWFSPYHYWERLLKITCPSAPMPAAQAESLEAANRTGTPAYENLAGDNRYLIVSGSVAEDGTVELRPFWTNSFAPGQYDGAGEGPYTIELLGSSGQVLFARRFDPFAGLQGGDHEVGVFHEILPYPPGVESVVTHHGGDTVAEVPVSAHAPTAEFLKPHGGELWQGAGPFEVSWEMDDADGDVLRAQILYSADGGGTWLPVAVNLSDSPAWLDGRSLVGSDMARLRLRVSDGVNTIEVDSALFRVARKAPLALITQPLSGSVYPPGEPLLLSGLGSDAEDGSLGDAALSWSSSLDGQLGGGRSLFVEQLSPGAHTITLTVRDSDEQSGTTSVSIVVGSRVRLPLLLKR